MVLVRPLGSVIVTVLVLLTTTVLWTFWKITLFGGGGAT
jgi:hypothetical protein